MSDGEATAGAGIPPEHLAALSHELRTPLSGVLGMARLLAATPLTAEQGAYVEALKESGEHLLGLVNDVLDYARLGAAHVALVPGVVDAEELLRSVCELMSPRAHEKGIEIGWAAQGDLPPFVADESRLRQILLNFAGNAVKFVGEGGVLLLAEALPGGVVRLSVADTGPGIPSQAREIIFEPFRRLDGPPGADAGGSGLGLAIVRRIADAVGGSVGVDGQEGQGATFWFESRPPLRPLAAIPSLLRGQVVAIASPSFIVREAAARQVEGSGGQAVRAPTLEEAANLTVEETVILADHAEAGDGFLRRPKGRRVVILLRPGERAMISGYRRAGFAGYLIKPLRRASLVARVMAAQGSAGAFPVPDDERIAPSKDTTAPNPMAGAQVLLAEDDPINAMLALTLLRREGCEVDRVGDGEAALAALARKPYDLVLMDVRMPKLGGMEATRRLRHAGVTVPVVALTADAFDDDRLSCLAAGMDDFIVKPLSLDALRITLDRWTRGGWTMGGARAKLAV